MINEAKLTFWRRRNLDRECLRHWCVCSHPLRRWWWWWWWWWWLLTGSCWGLWKRNLAALCRSSQIKQELTAHAFSLVQVLSDHCSPGHCELSRSFSTFSFIHSLSRSLPWWLHKLFLLPGYSGGSTEMLGMGRCIHVCRPQHLTWGSAYSSSSSPPQNV